MVGLVPTIVALIAATSSILSPHVFRIAAASPLGPLTASTIHSRADTPVQVIRGVNIGGWLVSEPWITPSLYSSTSAPDEWNLCSDLGSKKASSLLKDHWSSFYTQSDFQSIRSHGLSHVRIPIGYWSIVPLLDFEPYVAGAYPYLIQAVQWANEVGLKCSIDLHGAPGSQNGQDNSGLAGPTLFQSNTTNLERTVAALSNLSAEFSKAEYGGTVTAIELLNEPRVTSTGSDTGFNMTLLKTFYTSASEAVRNASAGALSVTIHDAFWGPTYWANYNPLDSSATSSPDWLNLDTHQYYAFEQLQNLPHDVILEKVCNVSAILKSTASGIPSTIVGEWSLETGVAPNATSPRTRSSSRANRTWLRLLFEAQLAAYSPSAPDQPSKGWTFWCWKTEYDSSTWSYTTGLQLGTIPTDISNASQLVFPLRSSDGCVDASYNWTAPAEIPSSEGARALDLVGLRRKVVWTLGVGVGVGLLGLT